MNFIKVVLPFCIGCIGFLHSFDLIRADERTFEILDTDPSAALVVSDGKIVLSKNKDQHFAVGSAFKLAVLVALHREIIAGRASWAEILFLKEGHRSLPTGLIQNLPAGTPFTLHTVASLMIALSDNTATDMLIDRVGRKKVERILGSPALTTREFFVLKANDAARAQFAEDTSVEDMAGLLAEIALPEPGAILSPWMERVEWMASVQTLCALIREVHDLSVFTINPGLASPKDWQSVAYKGGSEIGVLNLTTFLTARNGTERCVSVTWNSNEALDNKKLLTAYSKLLTSLEK